ncbi:helix-turn-helix domain-containing protein [Planctomycetota bacterium]
MEIQRFLGINMKGDCNFTAPPDSIERLLVSAEQAAAMLSIGRTHFYSMLSSGTIGPMAHKFGRRSLFSVQELRDWVSAGMPPRQRWIEQKKS